MSTTHPSEAERDAAAWRLVNAQIKLAERQGRWEPWKALAAIIAASAVMVGAVLGLSTWVGHQPQTINVHLDAPLVAPRSGG